MARRYGQTGLSSLVNGAKSAYEKQQSLNDQIQAYTWDLSAKTAEDYAKYAEYLGTRQKALQTTDPAKALSMASKITATQRAYTSSEISRQTLEINYGTGSDTQKLGKIKELWRAAINSGDENLAARLEGQAATLGIKIQNAADAAGRAGEAASNKAYAATKKGYDSEISTIKQAETQLESAFKQGLIKKGDYVAKKTQLVDALDRTYKSTYQVNPDGTLQGLGGLKTEDAMKYATDHSSYITGQDQKFVGDAAKILQYRPDLIQQTTDQFGKSGLSNTPIIGYDRVTANDQTAQQFGVNAGTSVGQIATGDVGKDKALKALGTKSEITAKDPNTGELKKYQVFANDYKNPTVAYTRDDKNIYYLVNKDGSLTMAKDVNQANTGTIQFAPEDVKNYRKANGFGDVGSAEDTFRTKGIAAGIGQGAGSLAKDALGGVVNALTFGAGNTIGQLTKVNDLRVKAEAAQKAAAIEAGKRAYADRIASEQAVATAQAARNAKVNAAPVKDYWAPAPYRDNPLIANPKNQAEQAYNIGSQAGIKIPKLR